MDQLEALLLALLLPGFAFTLWALWGALVDERRQHDGWVDSEGKRYQPINGDVLLGARARAWDYVALAAAQAFMLLLAILAALAANGPPRERKWPEIAIITAFIGLAALTSGGTVTATLLWRRLVRKRLQRLEELERVKSELDC